MVRTELRELVSTAEHTHAKLNATALMEGLERWDRLIGLVDAAADTQVEARNAARAAIVRWLDKFGWRAPPPVLPRADQRDQLTSPLEQLDDTDVRIRVGQVLPQT